MNRRIAILLLILLPVVFSCSEKEPEVEQVIRVESVTISKSTAELTIGETLQLTASVSPSSATNKEVSWSSSNQSVASVSPSGLVTAIGVGTVTITVTADGKKAECVVSVKKVYVAVSEVKLDKAELTIYEGKEGILTATILPKDATEQTITWSSSDPSIATVVSGKVTAHEAGNTTITASVADYKAECVVTVNMQYGKVAITDLKPVEIMPVIGQIKSGDKSAYDHIEHLRLAEATRIRDMMSKYGAGQHSYEEYQQLLDRLVVGMSNEAPSPSENYEVVGRGFSDLSNWGGNHSNGEWSILNSIIPNTRRIIELNGFYDAEVEGWYTEKPEQIDWINMESFLTSNANTIVILARSSDGVSYDCYHDHVDDANLKDFCRSGRLIFIEAVGNVETYKGILINKCFHKDVATDGHGIYHTHSIANGKNDEFADMALLVSCATNAEGDADKTGITYSSGVFPVGFHDKVLFAGRSFPEYLPTYSEYYAEPYQYQSSPTAYLNAAMMGLCFQMYAEAKDAFELLDMVRSTCLTDYIRLDGQTQPLQLINPAGLYKQYLTPQNLPTAISIGETIPLDKGYYKGVLFAIPGAEVKIGDEWIAFDNRNKDAILSQNPMTLEWRLNGELLKKYGYTPGQTVEGQIITVDDKWGGLRLEVPVMVKIH